MTPTVTQDSIWSALRTFLAEILPSNVGAANIIQAQVNRVAQPRDDDFVVMTLLRRGRLATNQDTLLDAVFLGSIAGDILTITEVVEGSLAAGQHVFGTGIEAGTLVTGTVGGTGGIGTYRVSPSQTVASGTISGGQVLAMQETQISVQIDVHGPNSADNAQVISTLMGDDYASTRISAISGGVLSPLYAEDPRQMPFTNEQQQVENRWIVGVELQINPAVSIPQEFAGVVEVQPLDVDATYPV